MLHITLEVLFCRFGKIGGVEKKTQNIEHFYSTQQITEAEKFDVLRGRLLGNFY